ncbi:molybdopterin-dependent oxidoreductase [Chloroflexota bacterium]
MDSTREKVVKSTCRMCHGVCGTLVHIKNGRVVKVTGDPDCPTSDGYICAKGRASVELLYHPDRLKYPMKRIGERGEGKWQRISWDEALDKTANEFLKIKQEYGAQSIVIANGTGRLYSIWRHRFARCLGTPNHIGPGHICYAPRVAASHMTCGMLPICDFYGFGGVYPKCIVVWGANITESGASDGMCGIQLAKAIRRGAKLIVIDPRRIPMARKADHWVQIRPGTDAALALGILHVIIKEGLYDKEFVDKWTVGFEELTKRVEDYPPDKVEKLTWVPSKTIQDIARMYATTKPACMLWGVAIDQSANNFQTARALLLLRGITGNIDVPGGDVFWVPPAGIVQTSPVIGQQLPRFEGLPPEMREKKLGAGKYRLNTGVHQPSFWNYVLTEKPYPIKALYIMGSNLLVTASNSMRMVEALKKIDFVVAVDLFMTPTAQLADVVLPAASWLEINDVSEMHLIWCNPVRQKVAQIGECWDDKKIMAEIAKRLGREDFFPWKDDEDYCNWVLKDTGMTFDNLKEAGIIKGEMRYRKYEKEGFNTPSGKFEFYCSALERMGYEPLPFFMEPPTSPYSKPELAKEYPLILTTGSRVEEFFHSEGRQISSLRKRHPDPLVEINPATAKDLEIQEGDWVWIETPGGRIRQKARLTDGIHPSVVSAQHGWWFPEKPPPDYGWKESNVNLLFVDTEYDPHTGGESLKSFLCKVYKD